MFVTIMLFGLCGFGLDCPSACAEDTKLTSDEKKLVSFLAEQTGNTDGWGRQYNIDQHEPAKAIIALGNRFISSLAILLYDSRSTKAEWQGRGYKPYQLSVGDVSALILSHVGGAEELKLLKRRADWQKKSFRTQASTLINRLTGAKMKRMPTWRCLKERTLDTPSAFGPLSGLKLV